MKQILFAHLLFIFLFPFSLHAKDKMVLAIMDFKAKGVPDTLAGQISELIRMEMINTGQYKVLEREQMDKILKEQEFQQTGCTDVSCAIQAGQLLSADKMLIGSVMKLTNKYMSHIPPWVTAIIAILTSIVSALAAHFFKGG